MNYSALYHKSDSLYAFPIDDKTVEIRFRAGRGDLQKVELIYGVKHDFSHNRKSVDMPLALSDELYDYYIVRLTLDDKRLAYIFEITDKEGNRRFYSEDGATEEYDFSLSFYNFFQLAYLNPADVMPTVDWLSSAVVYQIFVDRFNIGSGTIQPDGYVNLKAGEKPTPKSFGGGDLDGIREKLDYLCDLGVNALYLTPIFTSRSNHKYDISDYYNVDPHFGGNAAFARLMDACKKRGMRVILDAVFNHCSEDISFFRDVVEKGRASKYHDYFVIHGDKPTKRPLNYEVFASCDYMPKWNTGNPFVMEYLCGVGEYWVKNYGIDGWRLDVSDEVSHEFWRMFRRRIKACGSDIALIGENWHDSRSYLRGDQFDSIMNYAFTKTMLDYFARGTLDAERTAQKLSSLVMRNTTQVNRMMLNLLDSHDTHRFFTECRSAEKLMNALSLELFMPGASMIYYGTEIPLEGGYDPDSRRCFDWSEQKLLQPIKELMRHKKLRALIEGDVRFSSDKGVLIVERSTAGQKATLFVNNTDRDVNVRGIKVGADGFKIIVE